MNLDSYSSFKTNIITNDGLNLDALVTTPDNEVRGCALILPGSGNISITGDVSCALLGYSYYDDQPAHLSEQIANHLASEGIATVRYNKRGFQYPDQTSNQTLHQLAADASYGLRLLNRLFPGFPTSVVGFSEGALVALLLAQTCHLNSLHLMGLPTRPADEILNYQYKGWPLAVLSQLDLDSDRILNEKELNTLFDRRLPILGEDFLGIDWLRFIKQVLPLDLNKKNEIPLSALESSYDQQVDRIKKTLPTGELKRWYQSYYEIPRFSEMASRLKIPTFLYHGKKDAQINCLHSLSDAKLFSNLQTIRIFQELGHCFSPMKGNWGEIKTSGPISFLVLQELANDLSDAIDSTSTFFFDQPQVVTYGNYQ